MVKNHMTVIRRMERYLEVSGIHVYAAVEIEGLAIRSALFCCMNQIRITETLRRIALQRNRKSDTAGAQEKEKIRRKMKWQYSKVQA